LENSVRVPHQAIVEFIAAVTQPLRGQVILPLIDGLREAEEFLLQFTVLYPNEAIVRNAIRGCAAYQLSWFDAHLWSYAEHYGLFGNHRGRSPAGTALRDRPGSEPVRS
jgi:hypothetical protein